MSYNSGSNRARNFKSTSRDFEITRPITPWIDLFRLYILFSQYKSRDDTQEDWFFVLLIKKSACKHEYVGMHSF